MRYNVVNGKVVEKAFEDKWEAFDYADQLQFLADSSAFKVVDVETGEEIDRLDTGGEAICTECEESAPSELIVGGLCPKCQ